MFWCLIAGMSQARLTITAAVLEGWPQAEVALAYTL
jgi:hypothetical protein